MSDEEIQKLKEEIEELKRQNKILAEAFLNHIKGKLTIEDLEICYNALTKVKRYTATIGGYSNTGGIESVIAQSLLQQRQQKQISDEKIFEDVDEKEVKEIYEKLKKEEKKNEGNSKEG